MVEPVLGDAVPLRHYQPGTWGPEQARDLMAGHSGWHDPQPGAGQGVAFRSLYASFGPGRVSRRRPIMVIPPVARLPRLANTGARALADRRSGECLYPDPFAVCGNKIAGEAATPIAAGPVVMHPG